MIKRVSNSTSLVTHNLRKQLIKKDLTGINLENKKGDNIAILSPSFVTYLGPVDLCCTFLQRSVCHLDKADVLRFSGSKSKTFNAV